MGNNVIERKWKHSALIKPEVLNGFTFTGEEDAHTFVIDGGGEISGAITGKFINNSGVTVPLTGSIDGEGCAVVTLPDACYVELGRFVLTIWAGTVCIYCAIGSVMASQTETIDYPTAAIPDIAALIEEAQDLTEDIQTFIDSIDTATVAEVEEYLGIE